MDEPANWHHHHESAVTIEQFEEITAKIPLGARLRVTVEWWTPA